MRQEPLDFAFLALLFLFQLLAVIFYATWFRHVRPDDPAALGFTDGLVAQIYPYFQDIHVMTFIGFVLLLTSYHRFKLSQIVTLLLVGALVIQWYLLWQPLWQGAIYSTYPDKIKVNSALLVRAEFAAGSIMIGCSAILGKANQLQYLLVSMLGVFIYSLNEAVVIGYLSAYDIGGSMIIHLFGGLFGVGLSLFYMYRENWGSKNLYESHNNYSTGSIGTLFLWVFWPSFNGALAQSTTSRNISVINTYFALIGSCISAYFTSFLHGNRRFRITSCLNPSLSGAVVVAASANMIHDGWISYLVGSIIGIISVIVFEHVPSMLERRGYNYSGNLINLHVIPGLLGGILSAIVRWGYIDNKGGVQMSATGISAAFGLVGGFAVGILTSWLHADRITEDFQNDRTGVGVEELIEADMITYAAPISVAKVEQGKLVYRDDHGNRLMTIDAAEMKPITGVETVQDQLKKSANLGASVVQPVQNSMTSFVPNENPAVIPHSNVPALSNFNQGIRPSTNSSNLPQMQTTIQPAIVVNNSSLQNEQVGASIQPTRMTGYSVGGTPPSRVRRNSTDE